MTATPANNTRRRRETTPTFNYKLEIQSLKNQLALLAGGTDAAELAAVLAAREGDVAQLTKECERLRRGRPAEADDDDASSSDGDDAAVARLEDELSVRAPRRNSNVVSRRPRRMEICFLGTTGPSSA